MKKPKITEGEWEISKYSETTIQNIHGRTIASCGSYQNTWEDQTEENSTNAKAISAVPEMIDALIEIYECYLRGETIPFNPKIIEQALKKVGCHER